MLELANPKPGEKMADLGSGDGRIVLAFAKKGVESHGFELNPTLIAKSNNIIQSEKPTGNIVIQEKNFWDVDLSAYSIVTIYPMPDIMTVLEEKLTKELKPNSRILLNYYPFTHLQPSMVKDNIYLYQI